MPYASQADMVFRFTEREVIAITDRENTGDIDAAQLAAALDGASAEIDSHLGRRYALPLSTGGVPLVTAPKILVGLCCDIARYRLTGTEVQETEAIRDRYKDAIAVLQKLADGKVVFGESIDLQSSSNSNAAGASVKSNERCREFGSGTLGSY